MDKKFGYYVFGEALIGVFLASRRDLSVHP